MRSRVKVIMTPFLTVKFADFKILRTNFLFHTSLSHKNDIFLKNNFFIQNEF